MSFFSGSIIYNIKKKKMLQQTDPFLLLHHRQHKKKMFEQNDFFVFLDYRQHIKNNVITERVFSLPPS